MFGNLSILDLFRSSPTMVVLLVCSIITVGFAVERFLYFARHTGNPKNLLKALEPKLKSGNFRSALEHCEKAKGPVARVLSQALTHLHLGREELGRRVNTAIEVEQVEMERNLSVLGTMSNIAPLLGLFGTVVGIIRAFADIARTGSGGSSVVAMGVAEALMTTAAGIVVAVIATVFFNTFVRMIRTRTVLMEDAREEFFSLMQQQNPAPEAAPAPSRSSRATAPQQEPAPTGFLS
jgi:biopolymer transport protein ExbB